MFIKLVLSLFCNRLRSNFETIRRSSWLNFNPAFQKVVLQSRKDCCIAYNDDKSRPFEMMNAWPRKSLCFCLFCFLFFWFFLFLFLFLYACHRIAVYKVYSITTAFCHHTNQKFKTLIDFFYIIKVQNLYILFDNNKLYQLN